MPRLPRATLSSRWCASGRPGASTRSTRWSRCACAWLCAGSARASPRDAPSEPPLFLCRTPQTGFFEPTPKSFDHGIGMFRAVPNFVIQFGIHGDPGVRPGGLLPKLFRKGRRHTAAAVPAAQRSPPRIRQRLSRSRPRLLARRAATGDSSRLTTSRWWPPTRAAALPLRLQVGRLSCLFVGALVQRHVALSRPPPLPPHPIPGCC